MVVFDGDKVELSICDLVKQQHFLFFLLAKEMEKMFSCRFEFVRSFVVVVVVFVLVVFDELKKKKKKGILLLEKQKMRDVLLPLLSKEK